MTLFSVCIYLHVFSFIFHSFSRCFHALGSVVKIHRSILLGMEIPEYIILGYFFFPRSNCRIPKINLNWVALVTWECIMRRMWFFFLKNYIVKIVKCELINKFNIFTFACLELTFDNISWLLRGLQF